MLVSYFKGNSRTLAAMYATMLHTRDLARQADFWNWTTEKEFVSLCMAGSLVLVLQLQAAS